MMSVISTMVGKKGPEGDRKAKDDYTEDIFSSGGSPTKVESSSNAMPQIYLQSNDTSAANMKPGGPMAKVIENIVRDRLFNKYLTSAENSASFNLWYFLESLIIHMVYFAILGPISLPILIPLLGLTRVRNMQFTWGLAGVIQNLTWASNATLIFLYSVYGYEDIRDMLVFLLLATTMRAYVISFRYGYTSPEVMRLFSVCDMNGTGKVSKEYILSGWMGMEPEDAEAEVRASMWRLGISAEELIFTFRDKVPAVLHQRLTQDDYYRKTEYSFEEDIKIANYFSSKAKGSEPKDLSEDFYAKVSMIRPGDAHFRGNKLIREMVLNSKISAQMPYAPVFLSSLHCFLPFLVGAADGSLWNAHWSVLLAKFIHLIMSMPLVAVNVLIAMTPCIDYMRKIAMLRVASGFLNKRKPPGQYFPRMNMLCPAGVFSWLNIRLLILDFGKRFQRRANAYNSLFLVSYCLLFVVIILYYFEVVNWSFSLQFLIVSWFDLVVFLTVMFIAFYLGTRVNDQFALHKEMLQSLKSRVTWGKLACEFKGGPFEARFPYKHNKEIASFVEDPAADPRMLDSVLATVELVEEKLEIEREVRPLRILGIEPSLELLEAAAVSILSLIFAIINKHYSFM